MSTPDAIVKTSVEQIVDHIKHGETPHNATVKVARELELNYNFIKRSCEAINVALHHSHFAANPEKKAEDFETVDAQKVAEEIYGKVEKTAHMTKSELFSSFQYPESTPNFARYLEPGPHLEMSRKIAETNEITKHATSLPGLMDKASKYIGKLRNEVYEKEAQLLDAKFQVDNSFGNIIRKFALDENYRDSWHNFETAVYSKYGDNSKPYLDMLHKSAAPNSERGVQDSSVKLAAHSSMLELYDTFQSNIEKYSNAQLELHDAQSNLNHEETYIKSAYDTRNIQFEKEAELDGSLLEKVEASLKAERVKAAEISSEDPIVADLAAKTASKLDEFDGRVKSAFDLIEMASGGAGGWLKGQGKGNISANTNSTENNRNRALLLQELISTDPIISKFPTHQTVDAYQQLLRIAPELSNEKEITRAFLRQAGASQAIDPFQAEQLISANNNLFKQHQMQRGIDAGDNKPAKG